MDPAVQVHPLIALLERRIYLSSLQATIKNATKPYQLHARAKAPACPVGPPVPPVLVPRVSESIQLF